MPDSVLVAAPAKLNLFLHVTGKRADGYHEIESLAAFTAFGDTVEIAPADTLSLQVTGPFAAELAPEQENNLVMRAAKLLKEATACTQGAAIILHKNIPIGAGLGGGSSDAAAVLRGLQAHWGIRLAPERLQSLALELGSDIPVCLGAKTAWMTGIGEQVTPLALHAALFVVLVNPRIPLLTAQVYQGFNGEFAPPSQPPAELTSFNSLLEVAASRSNHLEAPATRLLPLIGDMLAAIGATQHCRLARMSGSGATCFGLYEHEALAHHAAQELRKAHPGWWVQETRLLEG